MIIAAIMQSCGLLSYSLRSGAAHRLEHTSFAWSLRESWVLDCFTAFAMTTAGKPTGWEWLIFPSRGGVPAGRGGCCFVVLVQSPPRAMNHHGQAGLEITTLSGFACHPSRGGEFTRRRSVARFS